MSIALGDYFELGAICGHFLDWGSLGVGVIFGLRVSCGSFFSRVLLGVVFWLGV